MPQLGQTDVVVAVPDVAVPVLGAAVGQPEVSPCAPCWSLSLPQPLATRPYLATKSLLTSRKMKKHSSFGV